MRLYAILARNFDYFSVLAAGLVLLGASIALASILPAAVELVLAAGVVFIFWPAIRGEWVFDDWSIADDEPDFRAGVWYKMRYFLETCKRPFYPAAGRPFTYLVYAITYKFWGFRPAAWHGVSLAMHAGAVVIVHRLALAWSNPYTAAAVAAIFAFHPLQVSSVAYISGRPNLQSVLLTLAGLWCFQLGAWPASFVFQFLAWRSKEDSVLYWGFYPICFYLFM
jgi:hypothetical protein